MTKAVAFDEISPRMLKEVAEALCKPLSVEYKKSLETGDLPESWEAANIDLNILKGEKVGDPNLQVGVLNLFITQVDEEDREKMAGSTFSRTQARTQASLNPGRPGFRDDNSCLRGLIEFYDHPTNIKQERKWWEDCIFLYCQKAFDKASHKRLLHKLEKRAGVVKCSNE
ncbi:uncharacterized protein [Procambarus clarkii]|uniref:uncharacterized protein n=1 Tax=Procambarus clarkii TaxID=6728 RepID=UPI0037439311